MKPRSRAIITPRGDDELGALLVAYLDQDDDACAAVRAMSAYDPDQCWRFLEITRAAELTEDQLGRISAGPFEDMMKRYGPEFIDRVEDAARKDEKMRFLIATVWRAGMSDSVWGRLEAIRGALSIERL